ncbi:aldo/keto reductase [Bacteroidota bacterium]
MKKKNNFSRRNFVKTSVVGAIGATIPFSTSNAANSENSGTGEQKIKEYRRLGRTNFKVSDISYGAGGLTNANVFENALKMGVNYIDTAEHYARGRSETTIGEVLKKIDRKSVFLTTKLNLNMRGRTKEDIRNRFHECLQRLQTDYVDCLMIHMSPEIEQVTDENFHKVAEELKAEGKVKFLGLSNHGPEFNMAGRVKDPMENVICAAVDDGRFDVALFVYNFLQKEQGERIIKKCKEKDVGVTLMKSNPINMYSQLKKSYDEAVGRGETPSERFTNSLKDAEKWWNDAESFREKYGLKSFTDVRNAATQFVLNNPDVHCVCPTINSFEDLETFIALSGSRLSPKSTAMLDDYGSSMGKYYCRHACGICESACPDNVPVNTIMRYNHYFEAQSREKHAMQKYFALNTAKANICSACAGNCESECPHDVPIKSLLISAHQNLTV